MYLPFASFPYHVKIKSPFGSSFEYVNWIIDNTEGDFAFRHEIARDENGADIDMINYDFGFENLEAATLFRLRF